jgi:hypothetical protein
VSPHLRRPTRHHLTAPALIHERNSSAAGMSALTGQVAAQAAQPALQASGKAARLQT